MPAFFIPLARNTALQMLKAKAQLWYHFYDMQINNKITVIEGPTPEFEAVNQEHGFNIPHPWSLGILEGPNYYNTAFTALRTFNSEMLLERCQNAWAADLPMYLVYRDPIGLQKETQIIAARSVKLDEGELIQLWVRNGIDEERSDISALPPSP